MSLWGDLPASESDALEAANGLRLFDYLRDLVAEVTDGEHVVLSPEVLCEMNRLAVDGLVDRAGKYRNQDVTMLGSKHEPPHHEQVEPLVVEMCARAEAETDPIISAAYVLWRLNWIHPFEDGNGRTARAAMYFLICRARGELVPGNITLLERIGRERRKYYRCLEEADTAWRRRGVVNVAHLAGFIRRLLRAQEREEL